MNRVSVLCEVNKEYIKKNLKRKIMMIFEEEVIGSTVNKLIQGNDYRDEVVNANEEILKLC
jgi:hypothetical protein